MSKGKGLASGSNVKKSKLSDSDCDGSGDSLGRTRMPTNSANPISKFYTHDLITCHNGALHELKRVYGKNAHSDHA